MSEINIIRPIVIKMNSIEFDDQLPSIKMAVRILIDHPTGQFEYNASDIWFHCLSWDQFIADIYLVELEQKDSASLTCLSGFFSLKITLREGLKNLSIECDEVNVGDRIDSNGRACLRYTSSIDNEIIASIKNQFMEFDKWW